MKIPQGIIKYIVVALVSIALGFVMGMEYKSYQIGKNIEEAFSGLTTGENSDEAAVEQQKSFSEKIEDNDEKIIEKTLGEIINLATIDVQVNSATENTILSKAYGSPEVAKEGAKFVVVDMTITNTTPSAFSYDNGAVLVDDKDRMFNSVCCISDNNLEYDELAPSIKTTGNLVFEVPSDVESYSLVYRKAGTNEAYKIKIK